MVWIVVCGVPLVLLVALGFGHAVLGAGESFWVTVGVGLLVLVALCALFGGVFYGLVQIGVH